MKTLDAALLQMLRQSPKPFDLGTIAKQLATTIPILEVRLAGLRAAGFVIESRPGLECVFLAPDRLIADDLLSRLGDCQFVRDIIVFEETDSTNNQVANLGRSGAAAGVAIFAERQTGGRGRFGRRWDSASHLGVWCSVLLRPELPLSQWPRLTTWAAVAIAAAIERITKTRAFIKWPNDIIMRSKKVAGILIETGSDAAQQPFAVLGFGINVNHAESDFPYELRAEAGSLRQVAGRPVDRSDLAVSILQELAIRFPLLNGSFGQLLAEAEQRSLLLGSWVRARTGDSIFEGLADKLDCDGNLLLRERDGNVRRLSAGEVSLAKDTGS